MSLEIVEKIRERESLDLALDNALNKLKRAVKGHSPLITGKISNININPNSHGKTFDAL